MYSMRKATEVLLDGPTHDFLRIVQVDPALPSSLLGDFVSTQSSLSQYLVTLFNNMFFWQQTLGLIVIGLQLSSPRDLYLAAVQGVLFHGRLVVEHFVCMVFSQRRVSGDDRIAVT